MAQNYAWGLGFGLELYKGLEMGNRVNISIGFEMEHRIGITTQDEEQDIGLVKGLHDDRPKINIAHIIRNRKQIQGIGHSTQGYIYFTTIVNRRDPCFDMIKNTERRERKKGKKVKILIGLQPSQN